MFLQVGVDLRNGDTDAPVALRHAAAEHRRGKDDERHGRQHNRGKQRAEIEHDGQDEDQRQKIAQNGYESRGEEVIEHVHVGGDARHQPAYGIAVVEREVQVLQMFHKLLAQVEHGKLPGVLHGVHLYKL